MASRRGPPRAHSLCSEGSLKYGAAALEEIGEIKEIWRGEVGRALKSGRVVALLMLFLLFTGLALTVIGYFNYKLNAQQEDALKGQQVDKAAIAKADAETRKRFIGFAFTDDEELSGFLSEMPMVLLVVFKLATVFLPIFVALMGFDQISGEIGPRSIRFLVLRARRSSIVVGKFLSQATLLAGLMAISTIVMVMVAKLLNADFLWGHAFGVLAKLLVAGLVSVVAYEALTTLCSAITRQTGVSLLLNVGLMLVIWFVSIISSVYRLPGEAAAFGSFESLKTESYAAYLKYVSVWSYNQDLLHPSAIRFLSAAMVHVGFGLFFLGLAHLSLRRRDL